MASIMNKSVMGSTLQYRQAIRSITYLHSGVRVRGLKREPSSYLKNPKGISYMDIKEAEYHEKVRESLQLKESGIELPSDILVQCLTHKSFAHGSKPYNEKLSLLGSQYLKYQASIHSIKEPQLLSPVSQSKAQQPINGLNFTNLGTQLAKLLISRPAMAAFVKVKNLDSLVFWKMKDPLKDSQHNGETTVLSSVLSALVGAILVTNGPVKTNRFVNNSLLNSEKDDSLVRIANKQFESHFSSTEK